jgi:hypothetical protein
MVEARHWLKLVVSTHSRSRIFPLQTASHSPLLLGQVQAGVRTGLNSSRLSPSDALVVIVSGSFVVFATNAGVRTIDIHFQVPAYI